MANFFDTKVTHDLPKALRPLVGSLTKKATEAPPQFPERKVADVDPLTQTAYQLTEGYVGSGPSDAYTTALAEARKTATTPVDVANMPEYQALAEQIAAYGQTEANRLQRGNIMTGNASWQSSAGRDVLGRSVTETQQRMMAAAVPFLQQARTQQQQAVSQLQSLDVQGQNSVLSKIDVGSRVGEILRGIEAAKLEAAYQNAMDPLNFRYVTQPQIASVAFGAPYTSTQQPSEYEKWMTGISTGGQMAIGAAQGGAAAGGSGVLGA